MMKGWKTWTGFGIMIASAILRALGYEDIATITATVGGATTAVGVAHKIEKNGL